MHMGASQRLDFSHTPTPARLFECATLLIISSTPLPSRTQCNKSCKALVSILHPRLRSRGSTPHRRSIQLPRNYTHSALSYLLIAECLPPSLVSAKCKRHVPGSSLGDCTKCKPIQYV